VTIFGQSAGGTAVCLLLVAPEAKGLFQRAVSESAAWINTPLSRLREPSFGHKAAEEVGESLGPDIAALRAKNTDEIMKLGGGPMTDPEMPIIDGVVLPDDPGSYLHRENSTTCRS